jgi:hypothetical protein
MIIEQRKNNLKLSEQKQHRRSPLLSCSETRNQKRGAPGRTEQR